MSLTLTLYPLSDRRKLGDTNIFCYERLKFDDDNRIFGQLTDLSFMTHNESFPKLPTVKCQEIPPSSFLEHFTEGGLERTREDSYGETLTFVYAKDLKILRIPHDSSDHNRAIMAFIDALSDDIPVILYW